jgi:hypothetical protein
MKIDPDIHIVMYLVFFGKTSVTRSQGEGGGCVVGQRVTVSRGKRRVAEGSREEENGC